MNGITLPLSLFLPLAAMAASPRYQLRQAQVPAGLDIGPGLAVPLVGPSSTYTSTATVTFTSTATLVATATQTQFLTKTLTAFPTTPLYSQVNFPAETSIFFLPPGGPVQSAAPPSPSQATTYNPIVAAYYPDWGASTLPPEEVDFNRFDWVDFAFAIPDETLGLTFTQTNSEELLFRLVAAAHSKGKFVKLSIGGWTGSAHFSTIASTPENRDRFSSNVAAAVTKFNLDGIDIDWEYPGAQGNPGNTVSPQDSANFLTFLRLLREKLPHGAVITAATQVWPFIDEQGRPMRDVRAFSEVLDWILLMNYDVWGSSVNPGPNAPLNDGCHNSTQPMANAEAAIHNWMSAGFPAHQITLGVPSYGYISRSSAQALHNRRHTPKYPRRRQRARRDGDSIQIKNDSGGSDSGQVQFNDMIAQGALRKEGGRWVGAGGFERRWDRCSSTPFLRSEIQGQIVTYDDPESLGLKADLAWSSGLRGVNMFDAHGDTAEWELVDAVRRGLRLIQ